MRDTRESRLLLVLLVAVSFALITVDLRGGSAPLAGARSAAAAVFGPVETSVAGAVDPVADAISAVRESGRYQEELQRLREENAALRQQAAGAGVDQTRVAELDALLRTAGAGRYRVTPAQVVAVGAAQGFSWTVTIDAGERDGIAPDMTVINGDGLVGRVTSVGPTTATVLLAIDPDFTAGTRMAGTNEIGMANGQGDQPIQLQLLNGNAKVEAGDRLVTFGSQEGRPFVPGVPVGEVVAVEATPGGLTRTVEVEPFVNFTSLDLVGVVVEPPRTDPRDSVLPPEPAEQEPAQQEPAQQDEDRQDEDQQNQARPQGGREPAEDSDEESDADPADSGSEPDADGSGAEETDADTSDARAPEDERPTSGAGDRDGDGGADGDEDEPVRADEGD
ncbi:rod shape-determining protein MreC [Allostreptomyces psammosilenae]|uniref:Cell shape-determining protein MreC n=1 Tax=Allostreptomyces psammosilenae TaxID=1892865 RepID=A0A852ZZH9_9ACTN|nr:rod shape-determining protein MreC [Allostreptomyces psammosilenae]NYI06630.1 rod shape-determining protein MreC [Allostreptomyces psammosilenae]